MQRWEFVKYWTGEECNKARIGMELPVLNSVVESEGIMNEDKFAPFYKMLEQSDGHTPASFIIEDWSEISENLSLSFEQLFNPSAYMDVKEVLKEAKRSTINKVIGRKYMKQKKFLKSATPYIFILPWIIGFLVFTIGPLILSLIMSFFDWPLTSTPQFRGFGNYIEMFTNDKQFWKSLVISLKYQNYFCTT